MVWTSCIVHTLTRRGRFIVKLFYPFFFFWFSLYWTKLQVNLLGKSGIERQMIKVRNTKGIVDLAKFRQNIHCSPQTFQIINIGSLKFSKFKGKVNFDLKLYSLYFLVSDLRERHWNLVLQREIFVDTDSSHKDSRYWHQIISFDEGSLVSGLRMVFWDYEWVY
jgi:hypothetical protein